VSVMTADPFEPENDTALWSVAALLVTALHVGVAAYLLLRPAAEGRAEAPVIDVAFMPAESTPAPAAPEALPAEPTPPVEPSSIERPKDEPVVSQKAAPQPEPPPPPVALTAPEPAVEPPPADRLMVAPPPPPKRAETAPEPKKPVAVPEHAARKPAPDEKEKAEREKHKAAPPKPAAAPGSKPTRVALAPNPGADSPGASEGRASWESELLAHIRRYATYSANGSRESGTARVGVTIDRNGRLLSRRLTGSSGSSTLDSAAMAVIERAQPYPRFPAGMNQAQIALTIPLHLRPQ
jgi:protein TonB